MLERSDRKSSVPIWVPNWNCTIVWTIQNSSRVAKWIVYTDLHGHLELSIPAGISHWIPISFRFIPVRGQLVWPVGPTDFLLGEPTGVKPVVSHSNWTFQTSSNQLDDGLHQLKFPIGVNGFFLLGWHHTTAAMIKWKLRFVLPFEEKSL